MAKIKNVSPLGDLYIPALNATVKAGAILEVAADAASSLLEQKENWVAADQAAASVAPTPTDTAPAAPAASSN
jgi:hypothetical protein